MVPAVNDDAETLPGLLASSSSAGRQESEQGTDSLGRPVALDGAADGDVQFADLVDAVPIPAKSRGGRSSQSRDKVGGREANERSRGGHA